MLRARGMLSAVGANEDIPSMQNNYFTSNALPQRVNVTKAGGFFLFCVGFN